jgi:1,2-diacylglycerol 3-alpha-glucosyltransferase
MKSRLKICMVSDDARPAATGVGIHVQQVSQELAARGHRVAILTTRRRGEPKVETWEGVRLYRFTTLKVYGFYQALPSSTTVRRTLAEEQPDLVHHHYVGFLMKRACVAAEALNLPQLSTYHFTAEVLTQPLLMRPLRSVIHKQIVDYNNRVDLVIAPSKNLASQIAREGIRTPIRYITNPVVFGKTGDVVPATREAGFTILYAGRLGPEKNLPYLLEAFHGLLRTVPDAFLWIAGDGPVRDALERKCEKLGISHQTRFLGFVDHLTLATYYAACDVFVLPSLIETQGMVAMEAMWFGKPVVVTRHIVSATEMVKHGTSGYIVDPASSEDLTARLSTLAADAALRASMGAAGRRRAEAYRPESVVDALEEAYRDVLAGRTRGP